MGTESTPTREAVLIAPEEAAATAVRELARAAEAADGDPPFSDQTLVDLRTSPERARLAVVPAADTGADGQGLAAAAVLVEGRAPGDSALLEAVVAPGRRGGGLGRAVVAAVLEGRDAGVEAWSHGDHAGARALAGSLGFSPVRELHRLLRVGASGSGQTGEPLPPVELPEGVTLRSFEVGSDEQEWLRVNAAAFAEHPEQGQVDLADLRERESEDWFDPQGFLLAVPVEDPARILGFHWTKQHPATGSEPARGEVYAVGISPEQQGRGLGRGLTAAGVRHLAEQGLSEILLYVDADNGAAFGLYESLGFRRWHVDVMFSRP